MFSLSCSSPPTECLELEEKRIIKGKNKKSKNQKRKKEKNEMKKKNFKRGTSLEFQPFQFIFF